MTRKPDTKLVDAIVAKVGLSPAQRRHLHDEIHNQGLSFREILEEARQIKRELPGKWNKRKR